MRSVGIDIGRYSIKVVETQANNRTYQIIKAKEYKILNPESNDQEIDILQTLGEIAKEFDTDSAKVTCSIRQQYVSTRKLFFPFKERVKIQKSLAFEIEDDLPLSTDRTIYDSRIIKFHEKSAEVIAMACVSEEVERTIDIMNRGHVDPDIITPEFTAIANLYEDWTQSPEESKPEDPSEPDKMIVHIGHSKTFVGVVSNNHMVWGRSIMWGVEKVASAISQAFQVPFLTALEMMPDKAFILLTTGDAQAEQLKMSNAVSESMEPLIQSLRLTIMLANTEYGANIEAIDILGGANQIKNIGSFFTQELEKPANPTNPLKESKNSTVRGHSQLKQTFQLAFGLSIEGLKRPINPPVNFRQMHLAKKNQSLEKLWEKWSYTAKVVATAYFCYVIYGFAIDSLTIGLEETSNDVLIDQAGKIANLKGGSATQSKIRGFIKENNKKAKAVKIYDDLSEINSPTKWIKDVSQILPSNKKKQNYDIRRFFIKNNKIQIEGVALDQDTINQILKALKGLAIKSKVKTIPATIPKEGNKKLFAFTFKVKRKN